MLLRRTAIGVVLALLVALPATAQDYKRGQVAYNRGDFINALREWWLLAEQGNARSQYSVGVLYERGQGVPQSYAEAAMWYRKAAEQGYSSAQYNLGVMYHRGRGVSRDYTEAAKWYRKAAEQGDAGAKVALRKLGNKRQVKPRQRASDRAQPSAIGRTVLLGTRTWDVESDSQGGPQSRADVWWEQVNRRARYLTPQNGAQLALLRGADYDSIGLKELRRARYSGERLPADWGAMLRPGTVVAMKTAEGNYAKLKVLGYRSLHDFSFREADKLTDLWRSMVRSGSDDNYHLEVAWSLYSQRLK